MSSILPPTLSPMFCTHTYIRTKQNTHTDNHFNKEILKITWWCNNTNPFFNIFLPFFLLSNLLQRGILSLRLDFPSALLPSADGIGGLARGVGGRVNVLAVRAMHRQTTRLCRNGYYVTKIIRNRLNR